MSSDRPTWDDEVEAYLEALGRGDRAAALARVDGLEHAGQDVLAIIRGLLAPAQLRVGELWLSDEWSVAQEHAATAVSESVIASLALARAKEVPAIPGTASAPSVVVSCVEHEWHALPALMVAEHLRADGFSVSYLGANASSSALVRHVHETGPAAVLLSCSLSAFLPVVRRQVEAVRETGTPVVVGGSAFDPEGRRARVLGATGFAATAEDVADVLRTLPAGVPPAAPLQHPGAEEGYVVFGTREDLADEVERLVAEDLGLGREAEADREPEWRVVLHDQLPHVVGSLAGALVADDPQVVRQALTWAARVLEHRGAPDRAGLALRAALGVALRDLPTASAVLELVAPLTR